MADQSKLVSFPREVILSALAAIRHDLANNSYGHADSGLLTGELSATADAIITTELGINAETACRLVLILLSEGLLTRYTVSDPNLFEDVIVYSAAAMPR